MGNLLKVLACTELEHGPIVFLDFEHAQPTEAETAVWNQVSAVLEEAHGILAELQSYNGAGQEIREAIQNPGDLALQEKAWNAVCPLVAKLKRFYEFSLRLENALRSLLEALTSPPYAPMQHLEREQALAKQFAEILHFTLSFDELKMTNPAIQNDFSYYRRTISRNRLNNQQVSTVSRERGREGGRERGRERSPDSFWCRLCRPAGSRERGQQRDGQPDVPVLRRGHADAEDAEQRHHQVCVREQDLAHRGHHGLPQHHGVCVPRHAGDPGVSLPVHQHRHHVVLHEGDGRRHHPLRPRAPGRSLRQDLQNRHEGVHQGAERAAVQQRGGSPERPEVGTHAGPRGPREHPRVSHPPPPPHLSPRYTTRHLNDDSTSKQIRALLQ
ncbi:unnamed protein product, partial [Tetraodon nigroviridis]